MFQVKQDSSIFATEAQPAQAIACMESHVRVAEHPCTFVVENSDGEVIASASNRKLIGTFTKQVWIRDYANHVADVEFDATDAVLAMSLEKIRTLVGRDTSTDDIGRAHVDWDGPFEVDILDPICEFFGVESVDEITQENFDFVRSRHKPQARVAKTVVLQIRLSLECTDGANLPEFVSELDYSIRSKTEGVKVKSTEVTDFVEA